MPCLRKHLQTENGHVNALPTILTIGNMADFSVGLAIQVRALVCESVPELVLQLRASASLEASVYERRRPDGCLDHEGRG